MLIYKIIYFIIRSCWNVGTLEPTFPAEISIRIFRTGAHFDQN